MAHASAKFPNKKRVCILLGIKNQSVPTRSYIISFEEDEDFKETIRNRRKESMDAEIDAVVDRIAQKKED